VPSPRIRLRPTTADDRDAVIEMETDPDVRRYLGGPRDAADVAAGFDAFVADGLPPREGAWAIVLADSDERLGHVGLAPYDASRWGADVAVDQGLELSYVLRRSAWGQGYAFEACRVVLAEAAATLPDQPVVLVTQTANVPSLALAARLGFEPVQTFVEFDAEQQLLRGSLHALAR
jgi:RimJ/RimL family protein N-acetyltransferase